MEERMAIEMDTEFTLLRKTARRAGLLYLLWILTAIYALLIVQPKTIVAGDAAATAVKILANEFLFRTGIVNGIVSGVIWLFLGMTLYRLFEHVDKGTARLLLAMVIVQIPAMFITEALSLTALKLFQGDVLKSWDVLGRQELGLLLLKMVDYVTIMLEMFWGLWLFPFGQLVLKSGFIPRILGWFLILNGIAYVVHFLTHVLLPVYQSVVFQFATPVWSLGEISIMLWLLVKGVRDGGGSTS